MDSAIEARRVTQDVLLFAWFKDKVITKEPSPEPYCIPGISSEMIDNLRISIWMQSKLINLKYQSIFSNFWERFTSSPYLFANYISYTIYAFCDRRSAHAYFFDALALVAYLTEHCCRSECKQFINACVDLFCAFFEKEIRVEFENQGGWESFNKYLETSFNLTKYRSLIKENKCPLEYYKSLKTDVDRRGENFELILNVDDVTQTQVETDERAVNFARSVKDKLTEICKEFDEMLEDFERTDREVKVLYQKEQYVADELQREVAQDSSQETPNNPMCEEKKPKAQDVADELAREVAQDSSQETQKSLQDTPNNPMCKERKREKLGSGATDLLKIQNSEDSRDVGASNITPKISKSKETQDLLAELSLGLSKLNDIILLLSEENDVKASTMKETDSKE